MSKDFSISIMMHPKRKKYESYLKSKLGDVPIIMGEDFTGIKDTEYLRHKAVWDTARKAWLSYDPKKKFHLVVQDDVLICEDFNKKVEKLLKEHGDKHAYLLYYRFKRNREELNRLGREAKEGNKGYFVHWKLQWAQAIIMPTKYIEEMVKFCDKLPKGGDDTRMTVFLRSKKIRVIYPIPSLVDHRPEEDSLLGFGHNRGRRANWFE